MTLATFRDIVFDLWRMAIVAVKTGDFALVCAAVRSDIQTFLLVTFDAVRNRQGCGFALFGLLPIVFT